MDADLFKMSSDHVLSRFTNIVDNWLSWAQKKKKKVFKHWTVQQC